jgi:hypothetical protein
MKSEHDHLTVEGSKKGDGAVKGFICLIYVAMKNFTRMSHSAKMQLYLHSCFELSLHTIRADTFFVLGDLSALNMKNFLQQVIPGARKNSSAAIKRDS